MNTNFDLTELATIPSELTGPLPRKLKATGTGIYLALVAPTFLALAVAAALWGASNAVLQIQHRAALRRDSGETVGEVTRTREGKFSDIVHYTFTVNGIPFTGKAEVPGFLRYSLRGFNPLAIRYLPANPDVNHPAVWEWSLVYWQPQRSDLVHLPDVSSESQWLSASLTFGAIGLVFLVGLCKERKLMAEGAPATAVVTKCTRGTRGSFLVEYEFRTKEGGVMTGSCSDSRKEIGASFCVLYLPQNSRRNMSYPSSNYRVAQ
jgi:hypothetical protein